MKQIKFCGTGCLPTKVGNYKSNIQEANGNKNITTTTNEIPPLLQFLSALHGGSFTETAFLSFSLSIRDYKRKVKYYSQWATIPKTKHYYNNPITGHITQSHASSAIWEVPPISKEDVWKCRLSDFMELPK